MKKICVIGSLNMDLTIRLPRFHQPGETITGTSFATYPGGKGGNQAVAAARLGGCVTMAGRLGDDANGRAYREVMAGVGIDTRGVETDPAETSGMALIEVDDRGENRIAIVPGTNALVDRAQIDRLWPLLLEADVFLLQLEIPLDTVCYAAQKLHAAHKTVLLDPAPAVPLSEGLLSSVDWLTPNETELSLLSGMPVRTDEEVLAAARSLIQRGARAVIAKLGKRGAMLVTADEAALVPGFQVKAVDTTAAGDSFNAGFAAALCSGDRSSVECVRFANAVGALSTTAAGAQGAMPTREEVLAFLEANR